MLQEGLIITVVGMSTVLLFLTLLVFAMQLMAKAVCFINKFMPETVEVPVTANKKHQSDDEEIAVAIAVAKINMN